MSGTGDNDLFLKIRWFPTNEIFDYTNCSFCTTGKVYDQNGDFVNREIIIEGTVPPPGPIGVPTEYEYTIKVPYFNTTTSRFDLIYRNDQGSLIVAKSPFFYINQSNCPTSSTYISDLISSEEFHTAEDMCNGTAFMDKIRPFSDLIVDVSEYCFKGSSINYVDFNLNPGKQIIIEEGNKLEIDYGHLYTCKGKMWKGIYVEKNAELIMTNSKIEDAEFGITFEKGAKLTLEDNEFVDNYVHMKANPVEIPLGGGGTGPATTISSFKRNTFSGNGNLVNKYDGQSTNPQDYPYAGIFIGDGQDGGYTCGPLRFVTSNSTDVNEFSQLANGIMNKEDGADLFVKGCTFKDITASYGNGYSTSGYGVLHETFLHPCIINGFENWPNNYSYNNVETALRTNLASIVKFKNQKVIQSERGVHSTKTILASYINDNAFSTSWNSIEIANTSLIAGDFEIKDNDIDLDIPTTEVLDKGGIVLANVSCAGNQFFSTSLISGNSIDAAEGETGITLGVVENLVVEDNFVEIAEDINDAKGISALGGNKLAITCNDFQGSYGILGNNTPTTGIYFSGLNRSTVTCNDISKTFTAIHVFTMNETKLKGNALHTNSIGIEYGTDGEPNAQTGPQAYHGNQWLNSYTPSQGEYGALHNAMQAIAEKSHFIVNDNQGAQYTTVDYPDFVSEDDDDFNFSCEDSLPDCTIELGLVVKQWDRLDSVVFTDTLFEEFLLRDLQWKVYRNMKEGILVADGNFKVLANNVGIHEMYEADSTLRAILQHMELDTFPDSLFNESSVDTLLNAQLDDLYSELASNYEQMQTELETYISNEGWATSTENAYLNYLSNALNHEASLWSSENGYLSTFEIGVCSYEGGDAWNRMNALQPTDAMSYSIVECADERESFIPEQNKEFELKVSPNPADYELQVFNIDGLPDSKMQYTIFDLNGRTVQSGQLPGSGMIRLNAELQSGLYILKVDQQSVKFNVFR